MSICLVSIASSDSFVHKAGEVLRYEFGLNHFKIIIDDQRLSEVLIRIQHGFYQEIEKFTALLFEGGFNVQSLLQNFRHCVVLSKDIVPIDLMKASEDDIGRLISISHIVSHTLEELLDLARKGLIKKRFLLERVAFLPITPLPAMFSRIEQDLIKSALKLSDRIAVDLLLQPNVELALKQFNRSDVQVLHVDSHATSESIQLSPYDKRLSSIIDFKLPITVPIVLLMACSTAKNKNSIAQNLLENGAYAVVGAFFDWVTGAFTNDISSPDVYDAFYNALLSGQSIGDAFKLAKRKMICHTFNAGQLLLGNQFIDFGPSLNIGF